MQVQAREVPERAPVVRVPEAQGPDLRVAQAGLEEPEGERTDRVQGPEVPGELVQVPGEAGPGPGAAWAVPGRVRKWRVWGWWSGRRAVRETWARFRD